MVWLRISQRAGIPRLNRRVGVVDLIGEALRPDLPQVQRFREVDLVDRRYLDVESGFADCNFLRCREQFC